MRAAHALPLMVIGDAALLPAVDLHVGGIQVDRDRALGQRCGRGAGSSSSIRSVTAATPCSTACHCSAVIRRARPAAVVEHSPAPA